MHQQLIVSHPINKLEYQCSFQYTLKHLLGIQDLSINDVNLILDEAHDFIKVNQSKNKKIDALRGKTQINLFFEPSTRTQSSFELAGKRLGADVMSMNISTVSYTHLTLPTIYSV